MAQYQGNPWRLDAVGDDSAVDFLPGVRPFIWRIVMYGGDGGNIMVHNKAADPVILYNENMASDTLVTIEVNSRQKGIYIDDLPVNGWVEVFQGRDAL